MSTPRILITTYGRDDKGWFGLPSEYVDSVRRAGGLPLLLPPGETRIAEFLDQADGLLLTGGGDLDPALYDGRSHASMYMLDEERDSLELALTRRALGRPLPTLCVCRGMQLLNVALGGSLIEHLPDEPQAATPIAHRSPARDPIAHMIHLEPDSHLAQVCGQAEFECMSWHHQAIRETGKGLRVVGRAPDGVIEAMALADHPWLLAMQWHPELSSARDPVQQRIFDAHVRAASGETQA